MISGIKKAFLLGLGAISITKEKAEKLFDEMVKRGEITKEEANELLNILVEKGKEEGERIKEIVKTEIDKVKMTNKFVTKQEFEVLSERVTRLEEILLSKNKVDENK
ncbi:MAG: hypothetical protein XD50_1189 [Clostridia bacterium 41_269]|nr:MAG: hypothetical protein XD50_1189 [Clostridia bacterium 41_269]